MVALKDKVQDALDEARTLVLGTQVLLGFQFQSSFEPGFARLSALQQGASLVALGLLVGNFALLLVPATYQILAARGEDTAFEYRLTTRCVALVLPLFAAALAIDLYLASVLFIGEVAASLIGILIALGALTA